MTDKRNMTVEEIVARIIDPSRWSVLDGYLAETLKKYAGENVGYDPEQFKDKASLAKARAAILAIADKRMSEERLGELLETAYDSEFYAMDISECAREIKALKAELAARTAFNAETAQQILAVHVQRANEAEAKLASARADALEEAAKALSSESDDNAFYEPLFEELCLVSSDEWTAENMDALACKLLDDFASKIRALKPVQGEQ